MNIDVLLYPKMHLFNKKIKNYIQSPKGVGSGDLKFRKDWMNVFGYALLIYTVQEIYTYSTLTK